MSLTELLAIIKAVGPELTSYDRIGYDVLVAILGRDEAHAWLYANGKGDPARSIDSALALVERVLPGWSIQLSQNPNNIGNHARICGEHLRDEPVGFFHGSKPLPITILIALLAALATQDSVGNSQLTRDA